MPGKALLHRCIRAARSTAGFTIVEMSIALSVIALMFTGTAMVLGSALVGASETRLKQHSTEAATEILEGIRLLDYASVATEKDMTDLGRLVSEGHVTQTASTPGSEAYTFDPDGSGPLAAENVVLATSDAVDPIEVLDRNGAKYTVRTIVSADASNSTPVRRVTTKVTWVQDGRTFARQMSTVVTETRRGLPLPNFVVGDDATYSLSATGKLHLDLQVSNNGARDTWNLTTTSTPTPSPNWVAGITWYADNPDAGTIGMYDAGVDAPLADTSGDGVIDTGLIETDETFFIVGYVDLGTFTGIPTSTVLVTPNLVSASQPGTPAKNVDLTVSVTASSPCVGGCTLTPLYLLNQATFGNTTLQTGFMPTTSTAPDTTRTPLPNYDTNKDTVANSGRTVLVGGTGYADGSTKVAKWSYQVPTGGMTLVGGNKVKVKVWVAMANWAAGGSVVLKAYTRYTTSSSPSSDVALGAGSVTSTPFNPAAGTWTPVTLEIDLPTNVTIAATRLLYTYVVVDAASSGDVWIAYGAYAYPSHVELPKQ